MKTEEDKSKETSVVEYYGKKAMYIPEYLWPKVRKGNVPDFSQDNLSEKVIERI